MIMITILRPQSPLCLLFLTRLGGYMVNSLDCYSDRLIGKLTVFLQLQEFNYRNPTVDYSTSSGRCSRILKTKVGSTLVNTTVLCINVNIDGTPITSKTHTHPSHSQTSRLLTSSLSSGVPVPRVTQCIRGVQISRFQFLVFHLTDTQIQVLSLTLVFLIHNKHTHRHLIRTVTLPPCCVFLISPITSRLVIFSPRLKLCSSV